MNNMYIKQSPRGTAEHIERMETFLPKHTAFLNEMNSGLTFVRSLKEIGKREKVERIVTAMEEIEYQGVFNQFIGICLLDMTVIYRNALAAVHIWDELYNLRQGYLLIYEAVITYNKHSKSIKELAEKATPRVQSEFSHLRQQLKQFKKDFDYDGIISDVRNNSIGHIEADPVSFFTRMSKLDTDQAFAALKSFVYIIAAMGKLSDSIYHYYLNAVMKKISFDSFFHRDVKLEIEELIGAMESGKYQPSENDIGYF